MGLVKDLFNQKEQEETRLNGMVKMQNVKALFDEYKIHYTDDDLIEIKKMYLRMPYSPQDDYVKHLFEISDWLCTRLDVLFNELGLSNLRGDTTKSSEIEAKRSETIKKLFPIGHDYIMPVLVMPGLRLVAGMVDVHGLTTFNKGVKFYPTTMVSTGDNTLIGDHSQFGIPLKNVDGLITPTKVNVCYNTWFCSHSRVLGNANIDDNTVVGAGAVVGDGFESEKYSLVLNNPAKVKNIIGPDDVSNKDNTTNRPEWEIEYIIAKLKLSSLIREYGLENGDFTEYRKALRGEIYNAMDPTMSKILTLTHDLVGAYNSNATSKYTRMQILDLLFPIRGGNIRVGSNLFVELLGAPKLGKDVVIGNNAFLAGNIDVGDKVFIGDNVTISAIGHPLSGDKRKLSNDYSNLTIVIGKAKIGNNVIVGDNTLIIPGAEIEGNTIVGSKKMIVNKKQFDL